MAKADQALYAAKHTGRNTAVAFAAVGAEGLQDNMTGE